jgi:hypothetical protein
VMAYCVRSLSSTCLRSPSFFFVGDITNQGMRDEG